MMPRELPDLLREVSNLSAEDRATLAGVLIDSLDPAPDAEVEAAWAKEIGRRVVELDSGSVKTIPWKEVRRDLFDRLNER